MEEKNCSDSKNDKALVSLKGRYFNIAPTEKYPNTPEITKRLDGLEKLINKRKKELEEQVATVVEGIG